MADIRGLPGFWLDIDLDTQTGAHVAQNLPKNLDQVIEIISDYPDPTTLVDSGHGIHAYWLFEQVHPVNSGNMLDYEKLLEYFQRKIIARAQALGYHVDSTYDITRVLRLPGTINYKAGLQKPVTVLDNSGPRYGSINTLLAQCQIDLRQNLSNSAIKPTDSSQISEALLQPDKDYAKAQEPEDIKQALAKIANPSSKALCDLILAGKAFAPAGSRDQTLQRVASIIAYVAPDRDPEELTRAILAPSLSQFEPEDHGKYTQEDRIQWASEKISRAQEDARRDRVVKARQNQGLADVLLGQARAANRRDQKLGPAPQGPYTDHELGQFAKQQNTTPTNFSKRWIIQKGAQYYVYVNGDYQKPIDAGELD